MTLTEFLNKWGPGRVEAMGDDLTAVVTEATRISKWRVREIEAAAAAKALATDAAINSAIEARLARVQALMNELIEEKRAIDGDFYSGEAREAKAFTLGDVANRLRAALDGPP